MDDQEIREHYADGGTTEMLVLTYMLRVMSEAGSVLDEYKNLLDTLMKQLDEESDDYASMQKRVDRIDNLKDEMSNPPDVNLMRKHK